MIDIDKVKGTVSSSVGKFNSARNVTDLIPGQAGTAFKMARSLIGGRLPRENNDEGSPWSPPSMDDILAVLPEGLSFANLYLVEIAPPKVVSYAGNGIQRAVEALCMTASIPFFKIKEQKVWINHLERKCPVGVDLDAIKLTFFIDKGKSVLPFFVNWYQNIYITENTPMGMLRYKDEVATDITLKLIDENMEEYFFVTLKKAYPTHIEPIELGYDSTNTFARLQVMINFDAVEYSFATAAGPTEGIAGAAGPKSTWQKLKEGFATAKNVVQTARTTFNNAVRFKNEAMNIGRQVRGATNTMRDKFKNINSSKKNTGRQIRRLLS